MTEFRIESIPALLVSIDAPRLRRIGLPVPEQVIPIAEHRLYDLLASSGPDSAHSRYNALVRRLVSASSPPGGWCLDFFAGSGTLGAVCVRTGRRFVLVDSSPDAVAITARRLSVPAGTESRQSAVG